MSKKITVTINKKTGGMQVKTEGYQGPACLEATKPLEEGLGMNQACAVPTAEMYEAPAEEQKETLGGS